MAEYRAPDGSLYPSEEYYNQQVAKQKAGQPSSFGTGQGTPTSTPAPVAPAVTPTQAPAPATPAPAPAPVAQALVGGTYRIQSGDTLSRIAAQQGTTVAAIMAANPQIKDPNLIYSGANLNLPGALPTPIVPTVPQVAPEAVAPTAPVKPTAPTAEGEAPQEFPTDPAEIANLLGSMGADVDTVNKILTGIVQPDLDVEELRTQLYDDYGITDLETKFKADPERTFEDIYSSAYSDLKLAELKTEIDGVRAQITDAEQDRDEAIGELRENPWLPQSSLIGRISRVEDKAQARINTLVNQLTLADTMYSRGKEEAENLAVRTLNTFQQDRQYAKEELEYYLTRAELDLEAKLVAGGAEAQREAFRYFPEYLKGVAGQPGEVRTQVVEANGRKLLVNTQTGETIRDLGAADVGIAGTEGLTTEQINNSFKLADDYERASGDFFDIEGSYNRVLASAKDPSAAGDLSLIFGYMKMLDPTSVVREGEQATAESARGVPETVRSFYNRVISGEKLTDNQRRDFTNRAGKLYNAESDRQDKVDDKFSSRGEQLGVPSNLILRDRGIGVGTGVPQEAARAIEASLGENLPLEQIRQGLTAIYGQDVGQFYLDLYMGFK